MKTMSVFNNKGGVGKSTLSFHLGHALASMGHRTLFIDLDPQCNLTIYGMDTESLHEIWEKENLFIDDFDSTRKATLPKDFEKIISEPRSVHFTLKPVEDGTAELEKLPPPYNLAPNLDLLPGRLTMHMFEDKISSRWSQVYSGDPLAIKTVSRIRSLAQEYAQIHNYEYVIIDTSPSLGMLNKVVISTTDCFIIPCAPDMFSLYGIRNIGKALRLWKKEFETINTLLSEDKRKYFPPFVQFIGYTIYNAKKYTGTNEWDLAQGSHDYAKRIPQMISDFILPEFRAKIEDGELAKPIGGTSIMHTHNTYVGMAQQYHVPIWEVPSKPLLDEHRTTIPGNRHSYEETKEKYRNFASDLLSRISKI